MGEHGTWFDYLYKFDWWSNFSHSLQGSLGRDWEVVPFAGTHWTLTHVMVAFTVVLFVLYGALRFRTSVVGRGRDGLIPPASFNLRHLFELICDATMGMMISVMGSEEKAKRFFPIIASLAFFILFCNLAALIPGLAPGTDTLKTNVGLAVMVFLLTHFYGLKEHGVAYLKHFLGPMIWLAPLMLPIELVSHVARPVSLSLRLMGNMVADHKVIFAFFTLVPWLIPVPFYFLGMLVCVVQTLVFCLLSVVYFALAIAHDH
ncbi:MAG: F0F1 ATP synthase subunit A [Proteobacteria bacterium]|nr:F0F1 ATP synthase subunit A [Pseudomonadota bacterium]